MVVGEREHHRNLAIVLFAEPAAILARYANRMLSLFGKACVINDPRLDRSVPFHLRHHHLTHLPKHLSVRPASLADEMQQRLVLSRNALRCRNRRHRLHALALRRQQQADAIGLERSHPIRVANNARYFLDISRKTFIAPLCQSVPHFSPPPKMWRAT